MRVHYDERKTIQSCFFAFPLITLKKLVCWPGFHTPTASLSRRNTKPVEIIRIK